MTEYPDKPFYKIGEVCQYTDTQPYVLRFWESEFPQLAPEKNRNGQRVYRKDDIELIFRIKRLLYEEEYTIAGARRKLEHGETAEPAPSETHVEHEGPAIEATHAPAVERKRWFDEDEPAATVTIAARSTDEPAESAREAEHFRKLHVEAKHELERVEALHAAVRADYERLQDEVRPLRAEVERLRAALEAAETVRAARRDRDERIAARLEEAARTLEGAP